MLHLVQPISKKTFYVDSIFAISVQGVNIFNFLSM